MFLCASLNSVVVFFSLEMAFFQRRMERAVSVLAPNKTHQQ